MSYIKEAHKDLVKDVHSLTRLSIRFEYYPNGGFVVHHNFESLLVVEVKSKQHLDKSLMDLTELVLGKLNKAFSLVVDGALRYQGRFCIPKVDELRNRILKEAHGSLYSIHPVRQKCTMTLGMYIGGKVLRTYQSLLLSVQIAYK